jgi:hypothetical protein
MEFDGAPTGYGSFDNKSKVILEENSKLIYSNDNNNFFYYRIFKIFSDS